MPFSLSEYHLDLDGHLFDCFVASGITLELQWNIHRTSEGSSILDSWGIEWNRCQHVERRLDMIWQLLLTISSWFGIFLGEWEFNASIVN